MSKEGYCSSNGPINPVADAWAAKAAGHRNFEQALSDPS